jgi:outer membrane biosynthesis protein TonB
VASARQAVTDGAKVRPTGPAGEPTSGHDYFTNAVPLRGDRELREHEERMVRLEQARPRRRRAPRIRTGAVVAAAVVLAAGGLFFLARSPGNRASDPPSSQSPRPVTAPVAPASKIGVAPAAAASVPRRRPDRARPADARPPHHKEVAAPETAEKEEAAPEEPTSEPEVVEPEMKDEPEQDTDAEPESQTAPEPEPSPPSAPAKASGPTSSSEADRQFGFGR